MLKTKRLLVALLTAAMLLLAVCVTAVLHVEDGYVGNEAFTARLTSSERVDIVTKDGCDYQLVFSGDSRQGDYELANELSKLIYKGSGTFVTPIPDFNATETKYEILIGDTDRALSAELLDAVKAYDPSGELLVWGYAYKDGKLAYTASSDTAFAHGSDDFITLVNEDGTLSVAADLFVIKSITLAEYEEIRKENYLDDLIEKNSEFRDSQFNTNSHSGSFYAPMIGEGSIYKESPYDKPWYYPTVGDHPRFLITDKNIEKISSILEDGKSKDSVYHELAKEFWRLADSGENMHFFGEFPSVKGASGEYYRYDGEIVAMIEAKALAYLITGESYYAYEALICVKNAMLTLHYTKDIHVDPYHGASNVMMSVAAVYDWCYDVLSETDKWQLIWGTAQILGAQLESSFRYPPTNLQGVNSHSTGPQILRDWLSVSSVFYDEVPDWWEYVAGAYFSLYVPVTNEQFVNGWVSQGTVTYGPAKAQNQAWAAYIVKLATGENVLIDDAKDTMRFVMSHFLPSANENKYFETGDGYVHTSGTAANAAPYLVVSALFNDPVLLAQAGALTDGFSKYNYWEVTSFSSIHMLCFMAGVDYNGESERDGIGTIQYFADPASQMTARESWGDPDSVAVMMKIGNLTMSDHDLYDHGTFQIYYKGLLATPSGPYNYGSDSHFYYRKATLSSNGLLVFNPAKADAEYTGNNKARYFYSGGQLHKQVETTSVEAWLESGHMADTTGAAWGYDKDGNSKYAYLSGDLTDAYDTDTVDYIGRKMFTLFTGDEDFPVLFFTFDQIVSDDETFTKHWLLHTFKEPTVDQDNLTATVINGDGKMYLRSLYGADSIVKIGGEGKAWWINGYFNDPNNKGSWNPKTQDFDDPDDKGSWVEGKNNNDGLSYDGGDNYENVWGRIELRTEGSKYSKFFTVMAVTDTENETTFEIEKFKNEEDTVYGAKFGKSVVTFLNSSDKPAIKQYKEFSFTTEGKGLYEYYIAGMEAGTWQVLVDGVSVAYSLSEVDGALITFVAPAGEITVKPGKDVIGANGGKIQYYTGGAIMPDGTPYSYNNETATPLPTENIVRGSDRFVGWYTSPDLIPESAITEIPVGQTGTVRLYAKWVCNFIDEHYEETVVNVQGRNQVINGINYVASGKKDALFATMTDENGINYLEWTEGPSDPLMTHSSATKNFSTLGVDDKCVSFTYSFMLEEGMTPMKTHTKMIAKQDVNGKSISSKAVILFRTENDGRITTHDGGKIGTLSTERVTDIRFVVDFKLGEIRYYDDSYKIIAVDEFKAPAETGAANTEEFLTCLTEYLWYLYGDSPSSVTDAALRIYGIRVQEGDEFSDKQTNGIKYNTNGARLPSDAARDFNADGSLTLLPTTLTREGYKFDGWYTTPTFDEGTKTTYAPEGSTGLYEVYAKWNRIFVDEDYSSADINATESDVTVNGITYNGEDKRLSLFKTAVGADGKKYLVWTPGEADSSINAAGSIASMLDSSLSYTFVIGKNGGAELPDMELTIPTGDGEAVVLGRLVDGVFTLGNSASAIATVEDKTTVRIVVDFNEGVITAYDEWGSPIDTVTLAEDGAELKSSLDKELFSARRINGSAEKATESICIYGIKVEEGNTHKFSGDQVLKDNSIIYETNGGELPEDAPFEYDVLLGTLLPTGAVKDGYAFGGWYTDADLKGESIKYVPYGGTTPIKVYAKWLTVITDENYTGDDFSYQNGTHGQPQYQGVYYNVSNAGTIMQTVVDPETGNVYLRVDNTVNGKNGVIRVTDDAGKLGIAGFNEDYISYEFSFSKIEDVALSTVNLALQSSGGAGGTGKVEILIADANGNITLKGGSVSLGTIVEGSFTNVRIGVDFKASTLTAFDENNEVIDFVKLSAPSGFASLAEWQRASNGLRHHILFLGIQNSSSGGTETGILVDDIRIVDGNAFEKPLTELPKSTGIEYAINGGSLPENAPTEYDPEVGTVLPTPTKSNAVFMGWYTTPDFKEGTEIYKIPAGTDGRCFVYARWVIVIINEDYSGNNFNYSSGQPKVDGINYNAANDGVTMQTVTDPQTGNTYVRVDNATVGKNGVIRLTDDENLLGLVGFSETAASYEISFSKIEDLTLSNVTLQFAPGSAAGGKGWFDVFTSNAAGEIYLKGGSVSLGTITEGKFTTVRVCVDFAAGTLIAYDEDLNVIETVNATPPADSGASTFAEWQRTTLKHHIMFLNINNKSNSATGLLVDNIKIADGNMFEKAPEPPKDNSVIYKTNGGELADDAISEYDPDADTHLPIPSKADCIFAGWYTTSTFEGGTRVEKIAAGTEGAVTVYARWYKVVVDEDYTGSNVNFASGSEGVINYNNTKNMYYTATDSEGNKYLTVNQNGEAGASSEGSIAIKNHGCITSPVVCYEMSFMKIEDLPLPTHIKLQLPLVDGGGMPTVFSSDDAGEIRLTGSDKVIGEIKEGEFVTLRIAVDFNTKTVSAYGEGGEVIDSVVINDLPTFEEINRQYHLFLHIRKNQNTHPDLGKTGVVVDNIRIVEGMIF